MKILKLIYLVSFITISFAGCDFKKKFDELRVDPSSPTTDKANIDFYLNHVQLSFRNFWGNNGLNTTGYYSLTEVGSQLTRMETMFTGVNYRNAYEASAFNGMWASAYRGVLNHVTTMLPLAEASGLSMHVGMAEVLQAYTMISLVDYFGDVPYSEAIKGGENTNPKLDKGEEIYAEALKLLDKAIADLQKTPSALPSNDLFYNGDAKKWITLAKTLKLRAYMTTRLVNPADSKSKIEALLTENDLIDSDAEEFVFRYGTQLDNPVSRHPKYVDNYRANATLEYIGTYFLWSLVEEKGIVDPRTRYYVYRQRTTSTGWNAQQLPCGVKSKPAHWPASMPYCILDNGFWGRDHGNTEGIPQDNEKRTTFGVYFAGGRFDNNDNVSINVDQGAKGQGIHPIWMASFTEFLKAEAALTLGTPGNARSLLESGVRKSIARVLAFPAQVGITVPVDRIPSATAINDYVNKVLALYDAGNNDQKLNVIMKEWYLALWGNGVDAFNNYRRTSKPDNLQLTIEPNPGPFIRSLWYPAASANLNKSVEQKADVNIKVFWDKNPDPLK